MASEPFPPENEKRSAVASRRMTLPLRMSIDCGTDDSQSELQSRTVNTNHFSSLSRFRDCLYLGSPSLILLP